MRKVFFLIILLSISFVTGHATNDSIPTKTAADSAYINRQFDKAAQIYEALLTKGESPEIYYNLGNSYFKSEQLGRAILNYERALLLNPSNSDIKANINIARAKTIDKDIPQQEIFFVSWMKVLVNSMSIGSWTIFAILSFIFCLLALAVYIFLHNITFRKVSFTLAIVCISITLLSNICAYQQYKNLTERSKAIVLVPSVTVRSTPSESGTGLFILHEGHKVTIKDDSMSTWKEISLSDGKVGWIPSNAIELI